MKKDYHDRPNVEKIYEDYIKENQKFNNIIYYDSNIDEEVFSNSELFAKNTKGSFIFCYNLESFEYLKIMEKVHENERYKFNLIISENTLKNSFRSMLDKNPDFKTIIKNVCILTKDKGKCENLIDLFDSIQYVSCASVCVDNFIKETSTEDTLPFPQSKYIITYEEYLKKYKILHKMISKYYVANSKDLFEENF